MEVSCEHDNDILVCLT